RNAFQHFGVSHFDGAERSSDGARLRRARVVSCLVLSRTLCRNLAPLRTNLAAKNKSFHSRRDGSTKSFRNRMLASARPIGILPFLSNLRMRCSYHWLR